MSINTDNFYVKKIQTLASFVCFNKVVIVFFVLGVLIEAIKEE